MRFDFLPLRLNIFIQYIRLMLGKNGDSFQVMYVWLVYINGFGGYVTDFRCISSNRYSPVPDVIYLQNEYSIDCMHFTKDE